MAMEAGRTSEQFADGEQRQRRARHADFRAGAAMPSCRTPARADWPDPRVAYGRDPQEAVANTGWTDEARAASLAVRRANPPSLRSYGVTPRRTPGGAGATGGLAENRWSDAAREASLAVRRAKAAKRKKDREERRAAGRKRERDRMFREQREREGSDFAGNWYPRGRDGKSENPYYGRTSAEAPYGYIEGTMEPRKEPLYDQFGRPIIPRPWEDVNRPVRKGGRWTVVEDPGSLMSWPVYLGGEADERDRAWLKQVDAAEKLWGRFGKKKRWMDEHPGATDADWEAEEKRQFREWKAKRR